jgi:beta-lactamase regulating signal transducer with metallopeptidase domain
MNHLTAIFLDAIVKTSFLLALFWIAALPLSRRSAATRHLLRSFGLGAALLLPALSWLVPAWHVPGVPGLMSASAARNSRTESPATQASLPSATALPGSWKAASMAIKSAASSKKLRDHQKPSADNPVIPAQSSAVPAPSHDAALSAAKRKTPWPLAAVVLWLLGCGMLLMRFALGRLRLSAIVGKAAPVNDAAWLAQVEDIARESGIRRRIELLQSHDIEVPLTTGALHPKVILSPDYAEWQPLRRAAILRHELAHIKRMDAVTLLLAQLATAVYWFNPLVWLTAWAMRAERERACDDYVLASGTKASEYAHELLEIATSLRQPELTAALAMARRSQLEGRVLAVLNPGIQRGSVSRRLILATAVLTLGIALPLAAIQASAPSKNSQAPASPSTQQPVIPPAPEAPALPSATQESPSDALPAPAAPADSRLSPLPAPPPPATLAELGERVFATSAQEKPAPQPSFDGCIANHAHQNMNIEDNNGKKSWIALWSGDDCSVDLKAEGDIRFNADASDLESISSGGFFDVSERRGSELRQIRITPSSGGLQYVYKLNGSQQPVDASSKTWLAHFLLTLERYTGFAADSRVPKLLKQGGPNAVLDEINNLQSDYVRGIYFRKLLDQPNLPAPVIVRVITQSGQQIKSDYEMARVLMEVSAQYPLGDETSRTAFLNAANHLKSDYEHSRVLLALLQRPNISRENVKMALDSAGGLQSDYEKSRILVTLAEFKKFDDNDVDTYLKLVPAIHSDYEKSRSLIALMNSHGLNGNAPTRILDAASNISSDYEKSRILITLAQMSAFNENQMDNYLKLVDSIQSDYEKSRSLITLLDRDKLTMASASRVMDAVTRIQSDNEKSRVLLAVAQKFPMQGALREKYINTANTIGGDFERKRALAAVEKTASI